ncbi:DUF4175 domain-containing protein [Paracoccus endophyticus]|uniref:DUF4175 domain-containing protein n=1 Tax=Paracoccus endophyticus TaxID=2233774 RepID=UPI001F0C19DB|nr:DUF4175 family protein [Paracoccus endophyticus]
MRWTLWGLWYESLLRAFWPALSLAALALAALALGLVAPLPARALALALSLWAAAMVLSVAVGTARFRRPGAAAALARVDATLPGRPLETLGDRMALGGAAADGLWRAHLDAARDAAARARPVAPDAGLARRDPFALRLAALTALAMAVLFGGVGPAGQGLAALAATWKPTVTTGDAAPAGPAWEGWAAPPDYTRRPTIYLNALPDDALTVPEGSVLTFRLYGSGTAVAQDIGPADPAAPPDAPAFTAERDGAVAVGERRFAVTVVPDQGPAVTLAALADRRADGRLVQGFTARDDNGIATGQAQVTLDLAAVDRRYGLAAAPEPRDPLVLDLPLPGAGARRDVTGTLAADLARHPWANLPVTLRLTVADGIGQAADTPPTAMILPGRRFFDPLAAALVELRRDLLWSRENAARSAQLLRAAIWRPDPTLTPDTARTVAQTVAALESGPLSPEVRDRLAEALWTAAVAIEDGGLPDALARMQQAQQRLSEAIRNGASPDEIQKLMDELKAATDAYTEMLAQQGQDPAERFDRAPQQGQQITGDQIQQMMDEIQRLMNEGRMAEAAELLEQFNRMMENLKVTQGEGGQGGQGQGPSGQLAETLREQQRLADEAMRQAQDPLGDWQRGGPPSGEPSPGEGQQGQGQPGEGQQGGGQPGEGQPGEGQPGEGQPGAGQQGGSQQGGGSLADRQRALREELGRQRGLLPGRGSEAGDRAGRELDEAGRAMEDAERALRESDPAGAMDRQADAIEAMREGMRALSDMAEGQSGDQGQGQGQDGQGQTPGQQGGARADGGDGRGTRQTGRDPLGRDLGGQGGTVTTGDALADAQDGTGRARDLQDEIRRRSGQPDRPRDERDYLGRLLDRF